MLHKKFKYFLSFQQSCPLQIEQKIPKNKKKNDRAKQEIPKKKKKKKISKKKINRKKVDLKRHNEPIAIAIAIVPGYKKRKR
jgi:cell division protein FtsL